MKLIILMILGVTIASCDPARTIEIENKTNNSSTIKFFFNGDDYNRFDDFLKKDSLILALSSGEIVNFHFGIGTWEIHNSLDSLIARVDKIEIITEKSTELFENDTQVESFFWDRLIDDRYKARIIIDIE